MWRWVGESAILVEYPGDLASANHAAHAHAAYLIEFPEVQEVIPGARTALLRLTGEPSEPLRTALAGPIAALRTSPRDPVEIHVVFDGEDLVDVAVATGCEPAEVIETVTDAAYHVALIGFMPGFPYLIGLPEVLHLPRRSSPRTRINAGSVAIAGPYVGIYTSPSPGGWHLLGHTEHRLFDIGDTRHPARLKAGQPVRLVHA